MHIGLHRETRRVLRTGRGGDSKPAVSNSPKTRLAAARLPSGKPLGSVIGEIDHLLEARVRRVGADLNGPILQVVPLEIVEFELVPEELQQILEGIAQSGSRLKKENLLKKNDRGGSLMVQIPSFDENSPNRPSLRYYRF